MARSIKTRGHDELMALKRRIQRQYALGRITKHDNDMLLGMINGMEAHIVSMREVNEAGEEEG